MSATGERSITMNEVNGAKRVALVTGGSRGIGRAVVQRLVADGFAVAFCYAANSEAADDVVQQLPAQSQVFHQTVDVRDAHQVRTFVERAAAELGDPEVLVTCAGITRDNPLLLMDYDDWRDVIDVNLTGAYNFCRSVIFTYMKQRKGSIVLLGSVAGMYGNATQSNYAASKAGLQGLGLSLAKELGGRGISVNVVAPGFIDTDMTASLSDKVRDDAVKEIPLGRFGEASEVADLVSFLVSGNASYITGQVIGINGGMTL